MLHPKEEKVEAIIGRQIDSNMSEVLKFVKDEKMKPEVDLSDPDVKN
jgi:hypothetical protein